MACTITYQGREYSYSEFASMLHDGLLGDLVDAKLVSESSFIGKKEVLQKRSSKFDKYREQKLGRDIVSEQQILDYIEELEEREDLSEEDLEVIDNAKKAILDDIKADKQSYEEWVKTGEKLDSIKKESDLEGMTLDDLIAVYNMAEQEGKSTKDIKDMIGDFLYQTRMNTLKEKYPKEAQEANSKDMTFLNRWMKTLTDVNHKFPAIQSLATRFNEQYHKKVSEANAKKKQLEKLGKAVIKEYNQSVLGKVSDIITTDSAKYFAFVDDGGKLRTNTTGLNKAQKEYLAFMQDLVKDRQDIFDKDGDLVDNTLIMTEPGFQETFRTEGWKAALKLALTPSMSQNRLNNKGALTSKFGKPYTGKAYSKDFYNAANQYIDDYYHIKYMSEFVPIVEGIEQFYKRLGIEEGKDFTNTLEFLNQWKRGKIYQESGVTDPYLDAGLRFLRRLTSQIVMAFNIPANVMNVFMGNYNSWRADGEKDWLAGQKRLFGGGRQIDKEHGYGVISKKAMDILSKYDVVSVDYDSNPKLFVGKLFDYLAHAGVRWGEVQIQGSQFLGQMTADEWNAFSYNDKGELVVDYSKAKMTEKEFNRKMIQYKDHVSDTQGKYSEKDRRNFMNYEMGKAAGQFKVWMPDYWKTRFGAEFIDSNNNIRRGSFNYFTDRAVKELKEDLSSGRIYKNKQAMTNLRGALVVASLLVYVYGDDDEDKKKKYKALSLENGLSNVLSIFDPHQLSWMIQNPAASLGTLKKFIDVLGDVIALDGNNIIDVKEDKLKKDVKKLIPYNKVADQIQSLSE